MSGRRQRQSARSTQRARTSSGRARATSHAPSASQSPTIAKRWPNSQRWPSTNSTGTRSIWCSVFGVVDVLFGQFCRCCVWWVEAGRYSLPPDLSGWTRKIANASSSASANSVSSFGAALWRWTGGWRAAQRSRHTPRTFGGRALLGRGRARRLVCCRGRRLRPLGLALPVAAQQQRWRRCAAAAAAAARPGRRERWRRAPHRRHGALGADDEAAAAAARRGNGSMAAATAVAEAARQQHRPKHGKRDWAPLGGGHARRR